MAQRSVKQSVVIVERGIIVRHLGKQHFQGSRCSQGVCDDKRRVVLSWRSDKFVIGFPSASSNQSNMYVRREERRDAWEMGRNTVHTVLSGRSSDVPRVPGFHRILVSKK